MLLLLVVAVVVVAAVVGVAAAAFVVLAVLPAAAAPKLRRLCRACCNRSESVTWLWVVVVVVFVLDMVINQSINYTTYTFIEPTPHTDESGLLLRLLVWLYLVVVMEGNAHNAGPKNRAVLRENVKWREEEMCEPGVNGWIRWNKKIST